MKTLKNYPLTELKLIYHLLYLQLPSHTELIDSEILQDLQHHLLLQAEQEGVDISQPTSWAQWLTRGLK